MHIKMFLRNEKGVALVVTAFVLIAIVVSAFAMVRVTYVPAQSKKAEMEHYREVLNQMMEVKSVMDVLTYSDSPGATFYWPIKLGYVKQMILGADIVYASLEYASGLRYTGKYGYLDQTTDGKYVFNPVYTSPSVSGGIMYDANYMYVGDVKIYYSGGSLYVVHGMSHYTTLTIPIRFESTKTTTDEGRIVGAYLVLTDLTPGSGQPTSVAGTGMATLKVTCNKVEPTYSPPGISQYPLAMVFEVEILEPQYGDYAKSLMDEIKKVLEQMGYHEIITNFTSSYFNDAINDFGKIVTSSEGYWYMIISPDENTPKYYLVISKIDYVRVKVAYFSVNVEIVPSFT
ncbi:MAG TPA: hypothetical protein ENI59_00135 [Euryarchaeota archaeon]|nr:hypothetical protein [Euryarchaeota archaeon]